MPVSFADAPDNRHVVMAWMSNWQYAGVVPTLQFRSANSVPRELSLYKEGGEHYLKVTPSPELDVLRKAPVKKNVGTVSKEKTLSGLLPANFEMEVTFTPGSSKKFSMEFSNDSGEKVVMTYDLNEKQFIMDRTQSGATDFSEDFPVATPAPLGSGKPFKLRLFVDNCSIEAFDGEGRFAMTNIVFPSSPYKNVRFISENGSVKVGTVTIWPQI